MNLAESDWSLVDQSTLFESRKNNYMTLLSMSGENILLIFVFDPERIICNFFV